MQCPVGEPPLCHHHWQIHPNQVNRLAVHLKLQDPPYKWLAHQSSLARDTRLKLHMRILSFFCRCYLTCHPGDCGSKSECRKRIKMTCPCKRQKQDMICSRSNGDKLLTCNEECNALKVKVNFGSGLDRAAPECQNESAEMLKMRAAK